MKNGKIEKIEIKTHTREGGPTTSSFRRGGGGD